MAALKAVYAAMDERAALNALEVFSEHWDKKYPKISISWMDKWPNLSTRFKYPQEVRRLICSANAVEGFNRQLRKGIKAKPVFPTDDRRQHDEQHFTQRIPYALFSSCSFYSFQYF